MWKTWGNASYTAKFKIMACKYTVEKENNTFSQHYTAKICTTCIQYLKLFSEKQCTYIFHATTFHHKVFKAYKLRKEIIVTWTHNQWRS
jgi:hypothetical protein